MKPRKTVQLVYVVTLETNAVHRILRRTLLLSMMRLF